MLVLTEVLELLEMLGDVGGGETDGVELGRPGAISHTYGPVPMAIQSFSKSTCSRSPQPLQRRDKSIYIIVGTSFIACTAQHFGCQAVQHNVMGVNIRLGRSLRPALLHHCSSALPSVSHTRINHNSQRHTHHCCFESGPHQARGRNRHLHSTVP